MQNFWDGFEKRAISLTGKMPGLRSGAKTLASPGVISKPARPTSGVTTASRTVTPPLPTPMKVSTTQNMAPRVTGDTPGKVAVPKPHKQSARGVSATNI